jgi:alpha-mannosidase
VDTSWQCDVFGHDPNFPQFIKKAGLSYAAWYRGPFHDWGIRPDQINFPTEFFWMAPDGSAILTHHMSAGYHAGEKLARAKSILEAGRAIEGIFKEMKKVSLTKNILLPMSADFAEPFLNLTTLTRWWNKKYVSPEVIIATPKEFFRQVRKEISDPEEIPVITRDMGPIFAGTNVTDIDSKLANRRAENTLLTAEIFATLAYLQGAPYPYEALDLAWRQILFNSHHDAITGTEGDDVYLDLTFGWREAYELGQKVLNSALLTLGNRINTKGIEGIPLAVFNPLSWSRDDIVTFELEFPKNKDEVQGIRIIDPQGEAVPYQANDYLVYEHGGIRWLQASFIGRQIPSMGYRVYQIIPLLEGELVIPEEQEIDPDSREIILHNQYYKITSDPTRGGGIVSLIDKESGKEVIQQDPKAVGNELVFYEEYPGKGEGRWVLYPTGKKWFGRDYSVQGKLKRGPVSSSVIFEGPFEGCRRRQEIIFYEGLKRIDFISTLIDFQDKQGLYKVHFPLQINGGRPIFQIANAVIGRSFGYDTDYEEQRYTLDSAAYQWVEYGPNASIKIKDLDTGEVKGTHPLGVGEIIRGKKGTAAANRLAAGLIKKGITTTQTLDSVRRYGDLRYDSNLPDFRISLGGEKINSYTANLIREAQPAQRELYYRMLDEQGQALLWLNSSRDLPVLIISERGGAISPGIIDGILEDLDEKGYIAGYGLPEGQAIDDYGVALINKGTPGYNIYPDGTMTMALLRSYQSWPAGVWITGEKKRLPDGSGIQSMHGTHTFAYSLYPHTGSWRRAQTQQKGYEVNFPLIARTLTRHTGTLPQEMSFVTTNSDHAIIVALKPPGLFQPKKGTAFGAEKPVKEIVLRAYETIGSPEKLKIKLFNPIVKGWRADLKESKQKILNQKQGEAIVDLAPYSSETIILQVKTRKLRKINRKSYGEKIDPPFFKEVLPHYYRFWEYNRGASPYNYEKPGQDLYHGERDSEVLDLNGLWMFKKIGENGRQGPPDQYIKIPGSWDAQGIWRGGIGQYYKEVILAEKWKNHALFFVVETNGRLKIKVFVNDEELSLLTQKQGEERKVYPIPAEFIKYGQKNQLGMKIDDKKTKGVAIEASYIRVGSKNRTTMNYSLPQKTLTLRPGQRRTLPITLMNHSSEEQWYEIQAISPINTWDMISPYSQVLSLGPKEEKGVDLYIAVPRNLPPGSYWAIIKILGAKQINYTDSIGLEIVRENHYGSSAHKAQ